MVTYSDWIWSEEHKKHYCAVYDDNGQITEYQWEGGYRQPVPDAAAATTAAPTAAVSTTSHSSTSTQQAYPKRADSGNYTTSFQYTSTPQASSTNAYENTNTSYQYASSSASQSIYVQPQPYATSGDLPGEIQDTVGGNKATRHVKTGADGLDHEKLHPSFRRVVPRDQEVFFRRGRVFKMLWTEPAGQPMGKTRGSTHYSVVRFQEGAWSEIRRFVVIQNKGTFSQCIPIQTYRGQGATKPGLIVGDHALIYTGQRPHLFEGEEAMNKHPIRVDAVYKEGLDVASRINFGKPYAVEHNVKLAEIGMICNEHQHLLVAYFKEAMGIL